MTRYKKGDAVHIHFGVNKCQFITPYPEKIKKILCVYYPGYFFSPKFKKGLWDGKYYFITNSSYFPTGLLSVVFSILKTGKNPLDENKKEYFTPIKKVRLKISSKDKKYYHPQVLNHYLNKSNIVSSIEKDTFAISEKMINSWKKLQDNTFQVQVQKLTHLANLDN